MASMILPLVDEDQFCFTFLLLFLPNDSKIVGVEIDNIINYKKKNEEFRD